MKLAGPVGFVGRLSPRTHDLRLRRVGAVFRGGVSLFLYVFKFFR